MKKIKLHPRRLQAFFKIPIDNEVDAAKTLESIIEETDEESSGQVEQVDGKEIILLKKALDYARTIVLLYPERKLQSMKILPKMDTTTKLLAWTRLVVMEHYSRENTEQWFESIEENVDKVFLEGKTLFKNFLKELKDMTH